MEDGRYQITIEYSEPNPAYKAPKNIQDMWTREMNISERLNHQALTVTLTPKQFEQVKTAVLAAWEPKPLDTKKDRS